MEICVMSSTRIWAGVVMLVCSIMGTLLGFCFLIGLSGCGGSTGLAGGDAKGSSGAAAVAEAGAAGTDNETGGSAGTAGVGTAGTAGAGGSASSAMLVAVELTPTLSSAAVGTQALIQATALYSNQMRQDVSATA